MLRSTVLPSLVALACALTGASEALAQPSPPIPPSQSGLTPSPAQLEFGSVGIHFGGSPQKSIAFSNESSSSVIIMGTTLSGTDASRFQITYDGCANQRVEPGSSCTVEIGFQPGEQGEKSAMLTLELFGGEGTFDVPLSGTGSTGTLTANPLNFSPIPYTRSEHEENQNETEQINIEAVEAGVQVESVSIAGPDASSFSVQYGNCEGDQLAENNWCDAGVRFQPLSPGPKHAQLVIKSDAQDNPLVIPLEGEGLLGPQVSLISNEAQLGEVPIGLSVSHMFTVTNSGDYPLFIQQSFLVSGTPQMFPLLSNTCSGEVVKQGSSCEFTVSFQPTATGEKDASIIFITNASPQINVLGIDGIGVHLPSATPVLSPESALQATAAPPRGPASAHEATDPGHLLSFDPASRLYGSPKEDALDTGVEAQCPPTFNTCGIESFITARIRSRSSSDDSQSQVYTTTVLGSAMARVRGGESNSVHITLSNGATALLKRHRHMRVKIESLVMANGAIIAERVRTVVLVAAKTIFGYTATQRRRG